MYFSDAYDIILIPKELRPKVAQFRGRKKICMFDTDTCKYQTESKRDFKRHLIEKHQFGDAIICQCGMFCGSDRLYARHLAFVSSEKMSSFPAFIDAMKSRKLLNNFYKFQHDKFITVSCNDASYGFWARTTIDNYKTYFKKYNREIIRNYKSVYAYYIE